MDSTKKEQGSEQTSNHGQADPIMKNQSVDQTISDQGHVDSNFTKTEHAVEQILSNPGHSNIGSIEKEQGSEQTSNHGQDNLDVIKTNQAVSQTLSDQGHVDWSSTKMEQASEQVLSDPEDDNMDLNEMEQGSEQTSNHGQADSNPIIKNLAGDQALSDQGHADGNSTKTEQSTKQVLSDPEHDNMDFSEMEQGSEQTSNNGQADLNPIIKNLAGDQALSGQGHVDGNSTKMEQTAEQAPSDSDCNNMDFIEMKQGSKQASKHGQTYLDSIESKPAVEQALSNKEHVNIDSVYMEQGTGQISHQGQTTTNCVQAPEERIILIIGSSRCGKSTIANIMLGSDECNINLNPSSNPSQVSPFCIHKKRKKINEKEYIITIIDSIGFDSELFSRQGIENFLHTKKILKINLIAIVIKAGRISVSERMELESNLTSLATSTLEQTSALIFTHCEIYDDQKRKLIIEEFIKDHYLGKIAQTMQMPIVTTGIPSDKEFNKEIFKSLEDSIKKDITQIEELITKAKNSVDVNNIFQDTDEKSTNIRRCRIL